jgi:hypothetical protein
MCPCIYAITFPLNGHKSSYKVPFHPKVTNAYYMKSRKGQYTAETSYSSAAIAKDGVHILNMHATSQSSHFLIFYELF